MRRVDIEALADAAGEGLHVLTALVRDTHGGVAQRVFSALGPVAAPARLAHTGLSAAVYRGAEAAARHAPAAAAAFIARTRADDDHPALHEHPRAADAIAALNGIYGDELALRGNGLHTPLAIRADGRVVAPEADALAEAFPAATGRIAVFVHGLCQTERSWRRVPRRDDGTEVRTYGDRLRDDLGYTPVYLRYNTGLHISTNGHQLDELLADLTRNWPTAVESIALVGHSMGGLVARSAAHYAHDEQRSWIRHLSHVICLGSPHLGADLEKGVNAAAWALAKLPETRGLAAFLNRRSDGVKDLRYGACLDADWGTADPDELLRDRCGEAPFVPGAAYHFAATTAGPALVGRLVGDHLVRPASACGRGTSRRIPFADGDGLILRDLHHFDLLNHPDVYAALHRWLSLQDVCRDVEQAS
jgi:pimeloyl-ACP methyl ester carboxylesterase